MSAAGAGARVERRFAGLSTATVPRDASVVWLDARLSGLARAAGAGYTRYPGDLVSPGGDDFAWSVSRFLPNEAGGVPGCPSR